MSSSAQAASASSNPGKTCADRLFQISKPNSNGQLRQARSIASDEGNRYDQTAALVQLFESTQ